jgi:hypothetical protein
MSGQALAIFNLHLLFVGLKFAQADTQQDAEHQAALACYNPNRSPSPFPRTRSRIPTLIVLQANAFAKIKRPPRDKGLRNLDELVLQACCR